MLPKASKTTTGPPSGGLFLRDTNSARFAASLAIYNSMMHHLVKAYLAQRKFPPR